jgi:hypothetical protein
VFAERSVFADRAGTRPAKRIAFDPQDDVVGHRPSDDRLDAPVAGSAQINPSIAVIGSAPGERPDPGQIAKHGG